MRGRRRRGACCNTSSSSSSSSSEEEEEREVEKKEDEQKEEDEEDVVRVPPGLSISVTAGPCKGQVFRLGASYRITVGRRKTNQVSLTADGAVSDEHAEVSWNGRSWILTDVGSTNGTWHNERHLAKDDVVQLSKGDVVKFGTETICKVQLTPRDLASVTMDQLLQSQAEAEAQRAMASSREQVAQLREIWREHRLVLLSPPAQD